MWIAKLRIKHDCWISTLTSKFKVTVVGGPLNSYSEKGKHYHNNWHATSGEEEEVKMFYAALHKQPMVKKMVVRGNQVFSLVEGRDFIAIDFDRSFFFIKPVVMKEGFEYWEIGSWERSKLMGFYHKIQKFASVEILKLKRDFPSVFIQHSLPKLTAKQRRAFEVAKEEGYYEYPRRVSVEELAKIAGVPRTTFQSHLRKAECKLLDVVVE